MISSDYHRSSSKVKNGDQITWWPNKHFCFFPSFSLRFVVARRVWEESLEGCIPASNVVNHFLRKKICPCWIRPSLGRSVSTHSTKSKCPRWKRKGPPVGLRRNKEVEREMNSIERAEKNWVSRLCLCCVWKTTFLKHTYNVNSMH